MENLHIALNRPDTRVEAAQILGDLIDEVRLTPEEDGSLKAELFGDLAAMLAYAQNEKKSQLRRTPPWTPQRRDRIGSFDSFALPYVGLMTDRERRS